MTIETRNRWFIRVGTAAIAAVALGALAIPLTPAKAQYLGVDLGERKHVVALDDRRPIGVVLGVHGEQVRGSLRLRHSAGLY